jgi:uncharacterized protein (TIGR02285 family)
MKFRAGYVRQMFCICWMAIYSATSQAQTAPPTITWLLWDFPPSSIGSNGQFTDGYIYSVAKILIDAWPEAHHNLVGTTTDNAWASLNRGVDACYASAILTPERERNYYMTQSLLIAPHSLIARKEIAGKLEKNAAGEVLPANLFDRTDLRGVIAQNRSYSALLDTLLDRRAASSSINKVRQVQGTSNILIMLAGGRGDYTIEYGTSYQYLATTMPELTHNSLVVLPIAGGKPVPVGIACPRTEWGRAVIQKADMLLTKLASRSDYLDGLKRWLPATMQKNMAPQVNAFLRQRTQPSDPNKFALAP